MIFTYKQWESFCKKLSENKRYSYPAKEIYGDIKNYIVLKHDVETLVEKAYKFAEIEHKYGHRGSYYVQAYLLNNPKNILLLKKIQSMGHEVSYHYDVMDSCKGDIDKALIEFESNKTKFEENGFIIKTLCQHGNPVIERIGYTSNRDFFRNTKVMRAYPELSDIMVNYKEKHQTEYTYISDAGRMFKMIYDPLYNDIINSDDRNIKYKDLEEVYKRISIDNGYIISVHPHRWTSSAVLYLAKTFIFKLVRFIVQRLVKIPFMKRIISKYYYLAKRL